MQRHSQSVTETRTEGLGRNLVRLLRDKQDCGDEAPSKVREASYAEKDPRRSFDRVSVYTASQDALLFGSGTEKFVRSFAEACSLRIVSRQIAFVATSVKATSSAGCAILAATGYWRRVQAARLACHRRSGKNVQKCS